MLVRRSLPACLPFLFLAVQAKGEAPAAAPCEVAEGCYCTAPYVHVPQWGRCGDDTPWSGVPVSPSSSLVAWLETAGNKADDAPTVEVDSVAAFLVRGDRVVASVGTEEANNLGGAQVLLRDKHAKVHDYPLPPRDGDTATFTTDDPKQELHAFAAPLPLAQYSEGDALVAVVKVASQSELACTRAGVDEHRPGGTDIKERGHGPWLCGSAGYVVSASVPQAGCVQPPFVGIVDGVEVTVDVCARAVVAP